MTVPLWWVPSIFWWRCDAGGPLMFERRRVSFDVSADLFDLQVDFWTFWCLDSRDRNMKWRLPIILCSFLVFLSCIPCSFLIMVEEYLQIFLGIPDTVTVLVSEYDTGGICHDSPWHIPLSRRIPLILYPGLCHHDIGTDSRRQRVRCGTRTWITTCDMMGMKIVLFRHLWRLKEHDDLMITKFPHRKRSVMFFLFLPIHLSLSTHMYFLRRDGKSYVTRGSQDSGHHTWSSRSWLV